MAATAPDEVYIPDNAELEANLADGKSVEYRIRYVLDLLAPARAVARMQENYESRVETLEASRASMAVELRKFRQMLGDLPPGERAAAERAYTMLGQIKRARGRLDQFERDAATVIGEMRRALEPPR